MLGSSTGTSRGVDVVVGLKVGDGAGVEEIVTDGERVEVAAHAGEGDDGGSVRTAVTLGVTGVGVFSFDAPWQAVPHRQMINRQKASECFIAYDANIF